MVPPGGREAGDRDRLVETLDRRALRRVRADVQELGGRPFGKRLGPQTGGVRFRQLGQVQIDHARLDDSAAIGAIDFAHRGHA